MSEAEYREIQFKEQLHLIKGKKTFLYGAGNNAKRILRRYDKSCHFCGVITQENEINEKAAEMALFGKKICTIEKALEQKPDCILIAAGMYSAEVIYQRIHRICRDSGVLLLDLYGVDQIALHDELEAQTYLDLRGWENRTAGYDVISFELLDTLIERDLFHERSGRVRPVFKRLMAELRGKQIRTIFIASPEYPEEWYRRILLSEKIVQDENAFQANVFFQNWTESFFRELKAKIPGKKFLHIGCSLLENGIIPRLCGLDTCRMVFYDTGTLTAFRQKSAEPAKTGKPEISLWQKAITEAEIISFDIFDTLLIRQTFVPQDVFFLTAKKAAEEGLLKDRKEQEDYAAARIAAQTGEITLDEIYRSISEETGLTEETCHGLMEMEIWWEEAVIKVRRPLAELLEYALCQRKRVVLVSDMYLTGEQLGRLLEKKGITGFEKIFSSCEYGISKRDGLFGIVSEELAEKPELFLHIGDSKENDEWPAERAGMKHVSVPTERIPGDLPDSSDVLRRLFYGIWKACRYENPFSDYEEDRGQALYRYGFTGLGPVMMGWLFWLIEEVQEFRPHKVLFAARDGWLLQQLYEKVRDHGLPESVYFYTSRHAAFLLNAGRPEMEGYIADMAKDLSSGEMLARFFEVPAASDFEKSGEMSRRDAHITAIRRERAAIAAVAEQAQKGYERYWRSCGLMEGKRYIYVDYVAAGTSQRMLEEVSPFSLYGRYFGRTPGAAGMPCEIRTYAKSRSAAESAFLERYLESEYYMTSPEPSLRRFSENGGKVFNTEMRTPEEIADIETVHRGIIDFAETCIRLSGWDGKTSGHISPEEVCRMYMAAAGEAEERRYFDDWSGRWI